MGNFVDLSGRRIGRLVVLRRDISCVGAKNASFICRCDCGNETSVSAPNLKKYHTRSCGCLSLEERNSQFAYTDLPEYTIWAGIWQRCTDQNCPTYERYGGRGISVCERWQHFESFLGDMGLRPSDNHSIERIENSGNYEKLNCCWATASEQSRNRRSNRILEFKGRQMTLIEATEMANLPYHSVKSRLKRGWTIDRALTEPMRDMGRP